MKIDQTSEERYRRVCESLLENEKNLKQITENIDYDQLSSSHLKVRISIYLNNFIFKDFNLPFCDRNLNDQ